MSLVNAENAPDGPSTVYLGIRIVSLCIFTDIYEGSSKNTQKNINQQCSLHCADGMQNQSSIIYFPLELLD